jgi:hypothetical protein
MPRELPMRALQVRFDQPGFRTKAPVVVTGPLVTEASRAMRGPGPTGRGGMGDWIRDQSSK